MGRVMVVDDQQLLRDSLAETLAAAEHEVATFGSAVAALNALRSERFECIVTDLKMPRMDGVRFLREIRNGGNDVPVIVMTAYGTVPSAVEAMKLGAFDYIQKPFEADELVMLVERAIEHKRLQAENEAYRCNLADWCNQRRIIGSSQAIMQVLERIALVAPTSATVLVTGESGTGKELVARAIHARSGRADRPMLCLNCAAVSSGLLESELFGHEKGAFTGADRLRKGRFELADGGTLLLDEISEIDMHLQAKLLRVLQEREFERVGSSVTMHVDVRVIATTNRDLRRWVAEGKFRDDLFYRLNVVPIHVPPLRERLEDIPELCEYFLSRIAQRDGTEPARLSEDALELMKRYDWPGNVRELENLMERARILCRGGVIDAKLIGPWLMHCDEPFESLERCDGNLMEEMERRLIVQTLRRFNGHRLKTARALGIGVRTLGMKLKRWRLQEQLQQC